MQSSAQTIKQATIGTSTGRLYGGNLMLNYTIGESFVTAQSAGNIKVNNGFWSVVPSTYIPQSAIVYRFIGTGKFSSPSNWFNGQLPPNPLPANTEVIIDPASEGHCILDIEFMVSPMAKFSVMSGKKLLLPKNLTINNP
ncbi:MAG: hypothetical protein EAY75_05940 [Bacteroidetes bacterium]|nr:MAG: hypothetical protein EAY75_05940 [Bacteroidota bacterium]